MKVIIVEDEGITSLFLSKAVNTLGHTVLGVYDRGSTLMHDLEQHSADLIFMDINIKGPDDGIKVATAIYKKYPSISCVFITSYGDTDTITEACSVQPLGYLHKPILFSDIEAILILVQAHRNTLKRNATHNDIISIATYQHDYKNLTLQHNDTFIKLSKQEHICLHLLLSHKNHHVTKDQLISSIWGEKCISSSSLRELISRIRNKLPELKIVNIPNIGYTIGEIDV